MLLARNCPLLSYFKEALLRTLSTSAMVHRLVLTAYIAAAHINNLRRHAANASDPCRYPNLEHSAAHKFAQSD